MSQKNFQTQLLLEKKLSLRSTVKVLAETTCCARIPSPNRPRCRQTGDGGCMGIWGAGIPALGDKLSGKEMGRNVCTAEGWG